MRPRISAPVQWSFYQPATRSAGEHKGEVVPQIWTYEHPVAGGQTAKVTANYAPKSNALSVGAGKEDNLYLAGDLSVSIPKTPIGLTAHLGHTFGPSYLSIGDEYTDWSIGANVTWNHITAGISYVDTSKDAFLGTRNLSGAGVVGSIGVSL